MHTVDPFQAVVCGAAEALDLEELARLALPTMSEVFGSFSTNVDTASTTAFCALLTADRY